MKLTDFNYRLPPERIAQKPAQPRDSSKLLVLHTRSGKREHKIFRDIAQILQPGDLLVTNDSKVIPARILGTKTTGGYVEIFLVRKAGRRKWTVLLKNFTQKEIGKTIVIDKKSNFVATPLFQAGDGVWTVEFSKTGTALGRLIEKHGKTPTPPYISERSALSRYQTVYAKHAGSVAAPTAGFHFTKRLLARLRQRGIDTATVTLHVGPGTFLPIRTDDLTHHRMHEEVAYVSASEAKKIRKAKKEGRRIIAVGTTSVRVLEGFCDEDDAFRAGTKEIDLFIYPGYRFRMVDALITNFHLPQSTLLLLVCAFAEQNMKHGTKAILSAYRDAVNKKYRFYSFGDSMFIT